MNTKKDAGSEMGFVELTRIRGDGRVHRRDSEAEPICGYKGPGTRTITSGYLKVVTCDACRKATASNRSPSTDG